MIQGQPGRMRGRLVAATVLALAVSGFTAMSTPGAGADDDTAPEATSPISLRLPPSITTQQGQFGYRYAIRANGEAFEIRANRPTYHDPITTTWVRGEDTVTLPEGSTVDWQRGLRKFVTVTVTRRNGTPVKTWKTDVCLNTYEQQRVSPDADPRSPYPREGCPFNPFTVGSVQGIQADWANIVDTYRGPGRTIKPGTYKLEMEISPSYVAALGIAPEDASDVAKLTILKKGEECRGCRAPLDERSDQSRDSDLTEPAAEEPGARSGGDTDSGPRPDLRSLPAFGIQLNKDGSALRFGANVWNAGDSPLVVDGFREDDEEHMDAYQYFFDTEGNQVGYEYVGELHYHEGNHHHWHFEDFARYTLVDKDRNDVVRSAKQSFCLANTDAVDYTVPGADWNPGNTDLATACGDSSTLSLREVLAAGSGDTYYQFRTGQAFKIANLPNGVYYIKIEANPSGRLIEQDKANNISYRKVILKGKGTKRRVVVPQVGVINEGDLLGQR